MSKITTATFQTSLDSVVTSDNSVASGIQALLEFGMQFYKANGRAIYLDKILNAKFRASRRDGMAKYVTAHTNLKVSKDKQNEGQHVFVVNPKSTIKTRTKALPQKDGKTVTWYEFSPESITVEFDIDARIKSLITAATAALKGEGKAKIKGPTAHVRDIVKGLEALKA